MLSYGLLTIEPASVATSFTFIFWQLLKLSIRVTESIFLCSRRNVNIQSSSVSWASNSSSLLGRETPGCGGADVGEWEGDRCREFCNRIRFFSRNRAALSCLHHLLDHGLHPVSDMDLWKRQFNKEREETHFYHTFVNEK